VRGTFVFIICFLALFFGKETARSDEITVDLKSLQLSKDLSPTELAQITRLRGTGFSDRPKLYLRLFKVEKTLEVWVQSKGAYKLFRSFDICNYSGKLGPKLVEGDRQAPEGFYHVPIKDLLWRSAKWPKALNLGFPNVYDAQQGRTGSYLLIHGGCSSRGCFAIKNGPMGELFSLVTLSARGGETEIPIHIFPFRFERVKWVAHKEKKWDEFWRDLQPVYDYFNKYRVLPAITVCAKGYQVSLFQQSDDGVKVQGQCIAPLPLMSAEPGDVAKLDWVAALRARYKKMGVKRVSQRGAAPQIKVLCNLKRPSCRRWLALKRKKLAKRKK